MKAVYFGGPLDGQVDDVRRNVFRVDHVEEVHAKGEIISRVVKPYRYTGMVKHPCKKWGSVMAFTLDESLPTER